MHGWRTCRRCLVAWTSLLIVCTLATQRTEASAVSWVGDENDNWHVGNNWTPNWTCSGIFCVQFPPQPDDDAYVEDPTFGTLVELSANAVMRTLEIRNGMFVDMNGFQLEANDGLITSSDRLTVDGFGSTLRVEGGNPNYDLYTHRFRVTNGGQIRMVGNPHIAITNVAASNITSTGSLTGNGSIRFHNFGPQDSTVLVNDGSINLGFGSLTLSLEDDGMFDLDGMSGNGVLDLNDGNSIINRSMTLTVDGPLSDNFDGTIRIGKGDRLHFTHDWRLGRPFGPGSLVEMNGYDGTATISGAPVIMDDGLGRIEVAAGTASFESNLSIYAGTMTIGESTTVKIAGDSQFNGETVIDKSGATNHQLMVTGSLTVNHSQFDWDGPSGQHVTKVHGGAMTLQGNISNFSTFAGTIEVAGTTNKTASLTISTNTSWFMTGSMHLDGGLNRATLAGTTPVSIGDGNVSNGTSSALVISGDVRIDSPVVEFEDDAHVTFDPGSELRLSGFSEIEQAATFVGTGTMRNDGQMYSEPSAMVDVKLLNTGELRVAGEGAFEFGTMTVAEFAQTDSGVTHMSLRVPGSGASDQLAVTGSATLDGVLSVTMPAPVANRGDEFTVITAQQIVGEFMEVQLPPPLAGDAWRVIYEPDAVLLRVTKTGDFNMDGRFDCLDVDALVSQLAADGQDLAFDLNGDNNLDLEDLALWLEDAGAANLPSRLSYLPGDANLDGLVNRDDLVIWDSNKFTSTAAWCAGDFNADGFVNGRDFLIWNRNKFAVPNQATTVPETTGIAGLLVCWLAVTNTTRSGRPLKRGRSGGLMDRCQPRISSSTSARMRGSERSLTHR